MKLTRRSIGRLCAAATIPAIAGCAGGGSSLSVEDIQAQNTSFGNVIVAVLVANDGSESGSGTLIGQVDMDGGDTYTESRSITVASGDSNTYELEFDIDLGESLSGGSYEYSARIEE